MLRSSGQVRLRLPPTPERDTSPGELFAAVRKVAEREYEFLGELGANDSGTVAYLARERHAGQLVALKLRREGRDSDGSVRYSLTVDRKLGASIPSGGSSCQMCDKSLVGWARFCDRCGTDVSGIPAGPRPGFSPDDLLALVRKTARGDFEILGKIDRAQGGGAVYFAREISTGDLVALRLQPDEPGLDGSDQYALGVIQDLPPLLDTLGVGHSTPSRPVQPFESRARAPGGRDLSFTVAGSTQPPMAVPRASRSIVATPPQRRGPIYGAIAGCVIALGVLLPLSETSTVWESENGVTESKVDAQTLRRADTLPSAVSSPDSGRASSAAAETDPRARVDSGALRVAGTLPRRARVTVNGRPWSGPALALAPGRYVVVASAPGFQADTHRVTIVAGDTLALRPRLQPVPRDTARPAGADSARRSAASNADDQTEAPLTCAAAAAGRDWIAAAAACGRDAEAGHTAAQLTLAGMYDRGLGVPADPGRAVQWLTKAADAGSREAQLQLAQMYDAGRGVARDERAAVSWLKKAAAAGDRGAQARLGTAFEQGRGVNKSVAQAIVWFRRAAEQGDAWSASHLGWMYVNARGVERDYPEALKWFQLAAERGDATAQLNLGLMYARGRGVAESESTAVSWFRKAAAQGNPDAQAELRKREP